MRRALPLAIALAIAVAGAATAVDKYIAFGDSITVGSSWPVVSCGNPNPCPIVFDCGGGCTASASGRESCGHARRLDDWIDSWAGAANHVRNKGVGGEESSDAVLRFPDEMDATCAAPGNCNAILLMHGTNDLAFNVSPETVAANLGFIIDEAKSRKIDTLLMTIIRDYDPGASSWAAYRDLVADLATDEDLQLVDTHATLCPNASCRDANYYVLGSSPCSPSVDLSIGHLDPDGYDVLTGLIQAQFPAAAPAAPITTAPTGDGADTSPEFVWEEAATARWYELQVDGSSTWWEAAAHCTGGSCTVDPGLVLTQNAHSWRVRGRSLRGRGAWSARARFTVWPIPGAAVPAGPRGLVVDAAPQSAPFEWEPYEWSEAAGATDYDLVVSDGGGPVLSASFDSSICSASICLAAPGLGLDAGDYSWTVQPRNPGASGPVSAAQAFTIWDQVPEAALPTAPAGDHFEPFAPLYEWLPATGASEYGIEVEDSMGNVDVGMSGLAAASHCTAERCSYQGAALPDADDYTFRVRGANAVGDGAWSSLTFTVLACADPSQKDLSELQASPVTTTAEVAHCGPLMAAAGGDYTVAAGGELTVYTRDGFAADELTVVGTLRVRSP